MTKEVKVIDWVDFGIALKFLKQGCKVSRMAWQKGCFIKYQKGYPNGIPCNKQTAETWGLKEGDTFICNPYLQIRNADGSYGMYSPTNDDVLSDDWVIYEEGECV